MSLFELLEQIVAAEGKEVGIKLPEEKINLLSLKILKREAERRGKTLKLKASEPRGKRLITLLEEKIEPEPVRIIRGGRFRFPRPTLTWLRLNFRRIGLIPLLLFGILLLLGGGAYWGLNFLPRAEVTLTLEPIPYSKDILVSVSTEATEIDVEKGSIPGTKLTVEEQGEKSTPATGTATVGEKAKGTVKFTNTGAAAAHVSAGDKLVARTGDLVFFADDLQDIPKFGDPGCDSKTVGVTAEKIGDTYNFSAGETFDVKRSDGATIAYLAAINDSAFTGGESHEVKIVSSADQAKVLGELKKELAEKGKTDLSEQAGSDQVVVQKAIKEEVVEENFAQKVGEQADKVSLTLKMKFTIIVYKEEDLQEFISQDLGERIPENYEIFPGEMEVEVLEPKLGEKALSFSAKITAQVIPKLDLEAIKSELAGRGVTNAREYLASLANVNAYELRLWPNLPENLRRVPRNTERIRIELQTEAEEEL